MPQDNWHPRRIAAFLALGVVLYLSLLAGSEWLVRIKGDRNPFFRIWAQDQSMPDWVVLGASHAMPLDFGDMNSRIEGATGKSVLNLAATGAGPFMLRLIADRYFADHRAEGVLIVIDGFGFADHRWNETRLGDADILPRIPLDLPTMALLVRSMPRLPPATVANYLTGFSKINNPDRLSPDIWQSEARFQESRRRPSAAANAERIAYLYPEGATLQDRYFNDLFATITIAHRSGARVILIRPPLPAAFATLLPFEDDLGARLTMLARDAGVDLVDHAGVLPDQRYYFDSDHLNQPGVEAWLQAGLAALLSR